MHTIKSPIKRHLELVELLPPDISEIADAAFKAVHARNYLRAIILRKAREAGALPLDHTLKTGQVIHLLANSDHERDVMLDALLAAARDGDDDWIALGRALTHLRTPRH